MQLVDTHCHLDLDAFAGDTDAVIGQARMNGVAAFVVPAVERSRWPGLLALCARHADLHPALGLHPVFIDRHAEADLALLDAAITRQRPVAVGEIGLDHWVEGLDRSRQMHFFEAQLTIAREHELPVLLHVRKAHEEVLGALARARVRGGIAHAFNGSIEQARRYLDLGFRLGFGGTLTYPAATRIRALAAELPLASIVLETDAPDMSPVAHRGERNSPAYLPQVLMSLAEVRDENPLVLARATTRNARAVLGVDLCQGETVDAAGAEVA
ncbi:MAG TPA: DNAase [Gammaproteobacteria bacterium]|nr:DNAase [Gammaproteobacteria bacterium]